MKDLITGQDQAKLDCLRRELYPRIGKDRALTIAEIGARLGHQSRRDTEAFLEVYIGSLPFCVVSSSVGYFRPASADDINHYHNSLKSRIRCMAIRDRAVRQAAIQEGFTREAGRFVSKPIAQNLPFVCQNGTPLPLTPTAD